MAVSQTIKELRKRTGISLSECKKALEAAGGDMLQALEVLKKRGVALAAKKEGRTLGAGVVAAYVHGGRAGALIVLSCETDFVAKNEEFVALARDIAMHAAAMQPARVEELLPQPFIKDAGKTIADLLSGAMQKFGERIAIGNISVFTLR